jgi:hypothetical protein
MVLGLPVLLPALIGLHLEKGGSLIGSGQFGPGLDVSQALQYTVKYR